MEESNTLFSLGIDPETKSHLSETATWARLLALLGFMFLILLIGVGIYSSITISRFEDSYREIDGLDKTGMMSSAGTSVAIIYVILALILFFPLLFTLRFANRIKNALHSNNQSLLNSAFHNLKITFRYLGITTIISLVLLTLTLVFGIAGLTLS
jgi:hypothetical protein